MFNSIESSFLDDYEQTLLLVDVHLHFYKVLGQDGDLRLQRVDLVLGAEGVDQDEAIDELMASRQPLLESLAGEEDREAANLDEFSIG